MYGAVIRLFGLYIPKTDWSEMSFPLSLYDSLSPNPEKTVAMQMRMIYATTSLGGKISIHYKYYEDRKNTKGCVQMENNESNLLFVIYEM